MADEKIEFFAQYGKWVAVKKMAVSPETKPVEVTRFLASVHETMDRKIWEYLGKSMDLSALDKLAYEVAGATFDEKKKEWKVSGRVGEEKLNEVLTKLKSKSTGNAINEAVPEKTGKDLARVYLMRKVFDLIGIPLELDTKLVEKYQGELG